MKHWKYSFSVTFVIALSAFISVDGIQLQPRQTLSAPCTECNNVVDALATCTDRACVCPPAQASGSACSSCLVASGFGTDAPAIASLIAECAATAAAVPLVVVPCSALCSNVALAAGLCSDASCLCSTLLPSGPACSSCLSASGFPADATTIGSYLATNCSALATSTTPPSQTSSGIACEAQCSNLVIAADTCGTNSTCLCPTVSASASACSACLVSAGETANAAEIGTILGECSPGTNGPLTAVPCASVCSNVVEAVSTCTDIQCQCPTLLASGPACSSCLSASGFSSDAAGLGAFLTNNCTGFTAAVPPPSSPGSVTSATGSGSVSATSGSVSTASPGTSQIVQSKSGAHGFGGSWGPSYIQFIMFLAFVAGLVCVFV